MKTKIVSLVLCLAVVFNLLPAVNVSAEGENFTKDGITYEINLSKPDEVSIVEIDDSLEILDIKHSVKDNDGTEYTVKSLSTLPDTITEEGQIQTAKNVKKIILPIEGIDIGLVAFAGFKNLTTVENLDRAKIQSSDFLFCNCMSLSKVNLPETLEEIGIHMFYNCQSLRTVAIGKNTEDTGKNGHCNLEGSKVNKIGNSAFQSCENLKYINLPESVSLEKGAFVKASKLVTVDNLDKAKVESTNHLFLDCMNLREISLPESIEEIGESMFYNCQSLCNVTIGKKTKETLEVGQCNLNIEGSKVKKIGDSAFMFCKNLKYINLPESIFIGKYAFREMHNLVAVNNLDKAEIQSSGSLFYDCVSLRKAILPEALEIVGDSMFFNCKSLRNITIGKNIKNIEQESFLGCSNLERVQFEDGCKLNKIGQGAFCGCENLRDCSISESISEIEDYAFTGCENLNPIKLNPTVSVGLYSFPEGKVTGPEVKRDKNLEKQSETIEAFIKNILQKESEKGRDINRPVTPEDIDKLLYEYTPRSTDTPNVVDCTSKEFKEMAEKKGSLVLYRGVMPHDKACLAVTTGKKLTAEEVSKNFKEGDFYYPRELNGLYCTKYFEHANSYAIDPSTREKIGAVLCFCFTNPDECKTITYSELEKISVFYKYFHIKDHLNYLTSTSTCQLCSLKTQLLNIGIGTMQFSFIARALGCDVMDSEKDEFGGDGCDPSERTSQLQVLNRGKLTVCKNDL